MFYHSIKVMPQRSFKEIVKAEFSGYGASEFKSDFFAGLTVAAVALPLALAFGVASGATAASGLVTAIIAGLVIGALSGAPFQISGPTGAMSAILILVSQKYGLEGMWLAGLASGVLLLLLGLFRLGRFISFIPAPVVAGFTSGIAVIIAVGQLDNLFGITTPAADTALLKMLSFITAAKPSFNYSLLLGLIVITGSFLWPQRFAKIMPASLFFLIVATALNSFFEMGVATIGEIPQRIILPQRLNVFEIPWSNLNELLIPVFAITALGAIESLLCGSVGSSMTGVRMYANRELMAQGIGNIIIPFCGGIPATAAIARTSVGIKAGGKTRMVSIIHALALLASMLILSPVMSRIPLPALAGILVVTAWRMSDWHAINFYFSKRLKSALVPFFVTMLATFSTDLTEAILIGTGLSAIIFLAECSQIQIDISGVETEMLQKSDIKDAPIFRETSIVYLSGPLFFAAAANFYEKLSLLKESRVVILSMRGVPFIDTSGYESLERLRFELAQNGGQLIIAALSKQVREYLQRLGFVSILGEHNFFWSTEHALRYLSQQSPEKIEGESRFD